MADDFILFYKTAKIGLCRLNLALYSPMRFKALLLTYHNINYHELAPKISI